MKIAFAYYGRYQLKESIELEYLSAIAKIGGHEPCLVCDPGIFGITDNVYYNPALEGLLLGKERALENILNLNPNLVVFSINAGSYKWACSIAKAVKNKSNAFVVFVGLYAALLCEDIIKKDFVDYVIYGESEGVFPEFLAMISGKIDKSSVAGVYYKEDGIVRHNPVKPFINLDMLPLPDKELFKGYVNLNYSYMTSASKGCLYACSYCEETAYKNSGNGAYYRTRSVNSVIKELEIMKERYGFKEVIFKDSFFTYDKTWLKEFLVEYKEKINVPFKCFGKIQYFDEETARLLKNSGCYCVEFGIQTWNQDIRRKVLNRSEENEQAREVFTLCDNYALSYDIDHMFGLPEESLSDHITAAKEYSKMKYLNRVKCHNLVYMPKMDILKHAGQAVSFDNAGDFFNTAFESKQMKAINESFRKLYKIISLMPENLVSFLIKSGVYRFFRYIPKPVIVFLQVFAGLKKNDLRFNVYLKLYPFKIISAVRNLL